MYKYLIRQSLRELKVQFQNYFFLGLGLIIGAALFLYSFIMAIHTSSFPFADSLVFSGGICVAQLFSILFQKSLVFAMHPAAMHFFFNSEKLENIKTILFCKKIISKLVLSLLICLAILNFKLSINLWIKTFVLCTYFIICAFIRWFKYNRYRFDIIVVFYLFSSVLFLLAFSGTIIEATIPLFIFLIFTVYYNGKIKVDWGRYYEDALYQHRISSASRHKNLAEMHQIVAEHLARKKHRIRIYHLPLKKNNALLCKALIESLRMSKRGLALLGFLLVFAVLLNKTTIFAGIPIIGEPLLAPFLGMFAIGTFFANVKQIYSKQIASLYQKHKLGFFIPHTFMKIVSSYATVCCGFTTLIITVLCIIFRPGMIKSMIMLVIFNLIMVLSFLLLSKKRVSGLIDIVANLVFLFSSGLLF